MTRESEPAYLLDTNICIYLLEASDERLRRRIEACGEGELVTSAVVYAEVMVGARHLEGEAAARALFERIPPQPFETAAGDAYAGLPFSRGNLDRLIAAHALALDLTLVTNNPRDFADIAGLRVENWTE
ncbi:type II toxin-antitoxin system VapC family toxin [Sphingomonas sp.]|uniref:type II toxin-antitoxin system VapC family toxin n=1 Tax=Sphingomonas sp. TaxID=28214 RepID=UPI002C498B73|nr:type II toxin-antitoxin system VapC family toxin [Sphingomonas sp.]HWK36148.1 type II toxin-antitoxin system VapC family toxin [Sphingomonas sp.]